VSIIDDENGETFDLKHTPVPANEIVNAFEITDASVPDKTDLGANQELKKEEETT
jgi:hypothetical protein